MGLRERERDPDLPGLAGEAHLRPPDVDELVAIVDGHLKRPTSPRIVAARWDYARWKPGVSITSVYALTFADGVEEPVVAKRYVDGKDRTLRFKPRNEAVLEGLCERLAPRGLLEERALSLWVPPADRILRGMPVLLDRRKLGHFITRCGIAPPGSVKKRKTVFTLLRYKPERRAVYRLDLRLRGEGKPHQEVAARVLPPAEAARVVAARQALEQTEMRQLVVPIGGTNLRQGFLLEPWLELEAFAPDSFAHAREAGALLARLHALTPPEGLRRVPTGLPGDLSALFAVDAELAGMARAAPHPSPQRRVFCHGDFHPDQVARLPDGRWLLMDLDNLAAGDPAFDLANWIADWIIEHQRADMDAASAEMLDGYRSAGGVVPSERHLGAFVAAELVRRAASTVRRLERGAIERARFALDAAVRIG